MTLKMKSKFVTDFQHQAKHIRNARTQIKENHYAKNSLNKRQRIQTMQNKQTIIISDNEAEQRERERDGEKMEQIEFAREIMFVFVLELI